MEKSLDKYIEFITQYRILKKRETELKEQMTQIRENVAKLLHEDQKNEVIVDLADGEKWKCGYEDKETTKVNYTLLLEMLGPAKYKEVVTQTTTTFLTIRKTSRNRKEKSILSEKPVEDDSYDSTTPKGIILS